ncbi:MAG: hypothetical protein IJU96_01125 [Clostridia bacterium]|nr:hypothetical protein [Clostridia bacterium]
MQVLKRIFIYLLILFTSLSGLSFSDRQKVTDFPKAAKEAKTLLLTEIPSDGSALTLASMQGLLANVSDKNLLFRTAKNSEWLPFTNAELISTQADGSPWDLTALLKEFAPFLDGYILCDDDSAAIALSLANQKNSIVVLPAFEEAVQAAGLTMTADVRGMSDLRFRLTPEFRKLRRDVAFEQPTWLTPRLMDYAVMSGAYVWYDAAANRAEHTNAFRFLKDNALIFGWNNDLGEYKTVSSVSSLNACLIPADWASNLSVLSGFSCENLRQKTAVSAVSGGRTVCLLMSDGDNLQWFVGSYEDVYHFGSSVRGRFPFAWGVPASAADLAAPLAQRYYGKMSENDAFVLSLSGLGYTFPSKWTNRKALRNMAETLGQKMKALDTRELLVLDDDGFDSKALDTLLKQTQANGIFYIDYSNYAGMKGKTRFVDGKPIVAARYQLWNGMTGCSPEEIAAAINALPADPADPDSYVFIIVHAWSGLSSSGDFVEGGNTMTAVERLVNQLDADTRLVSPAQFFERITANCG